MYWNEFHALISEPRSSCVLFVYEFRVSVRVKDKIAIVPLLFLTSTNN